MLINDPLPATTAPDVMLLPLAPTVVVEPGAPSIMALEVDDPQTRGVSATLMQFGDDDQHVRVPVMEGEGHSDVVENDFMAGSTLCKDMCNAITTVTVKEKAELDDGKLSSESTRTIVVDCRKSGDPKKCVTKTGKPEAAATMLCGDVTQGGVALSGDAVIDAHLDALTQLSKVEATTALEVHDAFSAIAMSLGIASDSGAADIMSALEMQIADRADAGLSLLIERPGCGLRLEQVSLALRACDSSVKTLTSVQCGGTCEPSDPKACTGAESSGCRGSLEAESCAGTCLGACEIALNEAAPCAGTCVGSCDGDCPSGGASGCNGPCSGNCQGTCRELSSDSCMGKCTGRCDSTGSGEPSCKSPLSPYCSAASSATLDCPGDCFGDASLDQGSDACRASAIAVAQLFPRCVDPLVQLSFAFKSGLSSDDQTSFAGVVHDLNSPLAHLYDALDRIALLKSGVAGLSSAESGAIGDQLTNGLAKSPDDSGLMCAHDLLMTSSSWLDDENKQLDSLESDASELVSAISVMMQ